MCLLSRAAFQETMLITNGMTYFDLSTDTWFMNEYTSSLFLPHTDLEKFPSVAGLSGRKVVKSGKKAFSQPKGQPSLQKGSEGRS